MDLGIVPELSPDLVVGDCPDRRIAALVDALYDFGIELELVRVGVKTEVAAATDYVLRVGMLLRVGKGKETEKHEPFEIHYRRGGILL